MKHKQNPGNFWFYFSIAVTQHRLTLKKYAITIEQLAWNEKVFPNYSKQNHFSKQTVLASVMPTITKTSFVVEEIE